MTKKPFKFVHDLFPLSEEQRQQYLRDASEYLGLPPDLNALDLIRMNDGSGLQKLVAYARKGTTDILRGIHGISVMKLEQSLAEGSVIFIATGVNKDNRQEIAVGSHSTEGLSGERLAYSVMTAQTRALRRLTLQFVGGGLLDDSEVHGPTTDVANTASLASLAGSGTVLPPPSVAPSTAPGRDITEPPKEPTNVVPESAQPEQTQTATVPVEAANQPDTPKRTRRKRNTVDISSPGQASANVETAPKSETTAQPAQVASAESNQKGLTAPVTAAPPALPPINCLDCGKPLNTHQMVNSTLVCASKIEQPKIETPSQIPSASPVPEGEAREFRKRLDTYAQKTLPDGGMMPSEGIGGVTMKLRRFAMLHTGAAATSKMTTEEFEDLLEFMDGFTKEHGAKALVEYINKAIGATK